MIRSMIMQLRRLMLDNITLHAKILETIGRQR
jgi:hypothetical protein